MSANQRLGALRALEVKEAASQGRAPCEIVSRSLSKNEYGAFDERDNSITMNKDLLKASSPEEALDTYFHESRHAYQYHAVHNPSPWDDAGSVQAWGENFDQYISPDEDFEGYFNQPVERDANEYAAARMNAWDSADDAAADEDYFIYNDINT
jgi:hypothetical protein